MGEKKQKEKSGRIVRDKIRRGQPPIHSVKCGVRREVRLQRQEKDKKARMDEKGGCDNGT